MRISVTPLSTAVRNVKDNCSVLQTFEMTRAAIIIPKIFRNGYKQVRRVRVQQIRNVWHDNYPDKHYGVRLACVVLSGSKLGGREIDRFECLKS